MVDRIGTEIAGYFIESLIARGGMGEVYLARQSFPQRRVALKLLPPELASDSAFRERFVRESNAAAAVEHPNIVPIYGAGEADGQLYIAMRYIEGTDLANLLRQGVLDPQRAGAILAQIADALDEAHEHGLVHRDVKPANILVARGDRSYLTDFGLIRKNTLEVGLTKTGQFMGTISYVAPEQITGKQVDGRTDEYELACVLFECLTGSIPFPREEETAMLFAHLQDPPPRVSELRPLSPAEIDDVLARGMAKEKEDRFGTCTELMQAAFAALGFAFSTSGPRVAPSISETRVAAPPSSPPPQPSAPSGPPVSVAPPPPSAPEVSVSPPPPPESRGRRAIVVPLVAVAIVGGAIAGIALTKSGGDTKPGVSPTSSATSVQTPTESPTASPSPSPTGTVVSITLPEWVSSAQTVLDQSASARHRLVAALTDANNTSDPASLRADLRVIKDVTDTRAVAVQLVSGWPVPQEAAKANSTLLDALGAALDTDREYENYVQALVQGDAATAQAALDRSKVPQAAAGKAKDAFITQYNRLRIQVGLAPLPPDFFF